MRAKKAGFSLEICFESTVFHNVGSSSEKRSYIAYFHYIKNTIACFKKNFSLFFFLTIFLYHFSKCLFLALSLKAKVRDLKGYIIGFIVGYKSF